MFNYGVDLVGQPWGAVYNLVHNLWVPSAQYAFLAFIMGYVRHNIKLGIPEDDWHQHFDLAKLFRGEDVAACAGYCLALRYLGATIGYFSRYVHIANAAGVQHTVVEFLLKGGYVFFDPLFGFASRGLKSVADLIADPAEVIAWEQAGGPYSARYGESGAAYLHTLVD